MARSKIICPQCKTKFKESEFGGLFIDYEKNKHIKFCSGTCEFYFRKNREIK